MTSSHALLQAFVPDRVRGQIMAFYTMCYGGAVSIASLAVGVLTHRLGVQVMFVLSAAMYLAAGIALRGILPELRREINPVLTAKGLVGT